MKKKALIVTVGILFVVLLGTIFTGTTRYSCTSMEKLFANDKLLFHNAAETLLDHPCDGGIQRHQRSPKKGVAGDFFGIIRLLQRKNA